MKIIIKADSGYTLLQPYDTGAGEYYFWRCPIVAWSIDSKSEKPSPITLSKQVRELYGIEYPDGTVHVTSDDNGADVSNEMYYINDQHYLDMIKAKHSRHPMSMASIVSDYGKNDRKKMRRKKGM